MSLNFAAISPHAPIIVPGVGQRKDLDRVGSTVASMRKLAHLFNTAEIDTAVVISPHMLIYPDRFNICGMKKIFGTFAAFEAPDIMMEFNNDLELAGLIQEQAAKSEKEALLFNNDGEFFELDHGLMVPLYYLSQNQESTFKVLPMAYSNLDRASHFAFGQAISDAVSKYPQRVGVIASGDLSHRLIQGAPAGYSKVGQEFDKRLVEDLKNNNIQKILYYDDDFVESAGECGYRSILILLGILDGLKIKPEILSYEGPFGVGYLVTNFGLKS